MSVREWHLSLNNQCNLIEISKDYGNRNNRSGQRGVNRYIKCKK